MMSEQDKKGLAEVLSDNAEGILVGVLAVAVVAALVVGGAYVIYFKGVPVSGDPGSWGQLGDYLGGVLNPVFGFLSVFALLVALVLQTRELKLSRESLALSREELRLSRDEQAKAAEALALQNQAIQQQSFEQTFFSLLRLLGDRLEAVVFRQSLAPDSPIANPSAKGRSALRAVTHTLRITIDKGDIEGSYHGYVSATIGGLLRSPQLVGFSEYARTLTVILEYLSGAKVSGADIYPKLLRSQMDREEVIFVYFLCLVDGWGSLKDGVERYGLLADIDPEDTAAMSDYYTYFERSAFRTF